MKPTVLLFSLFLLGLAACKKEDKCENVICLNGGTCDDGTCICINGFSGQLCETAPDPCAGITCLNGGVCANGVCNCPPGYAGSDCSQQLTPTSITINSIKVTKWPLTESSGGSWDFTSGADAYVRLMRGSTILASNQADMITNATDAELFWPSLSSDFTIDQVSATHSLVLYDSDSPDADDFMGGIDFTPYATASAFPTNLFLGCQGCDTEFFITLTYNF